MQPTPSLVSQTRNPARIAFCIVHDTKSDLPWGWLGLACKPKIECGVHIVLSCLFMYNVHMRAVDRCIYDNQLQTNPEDGMHV